MRRAWAVALVVVVVAGGCVPASQPDADRSARDAAHLQEAFPVLEDLRVRGFRDQDRCRFIDYPPGAFTSVANAASACNLFDGPPKAFDDAANADFERVRAALGKARVSTDIVWWIEYDDAGQMKSAEFDLRAGGFGGRWSYVYERGGSMPQDIPGESVYGQINDDWWFWWEDWN